MSSNRTPIPALAAVGACHHHLIKTGLRSDTSIVVDTATCFSTHHAAMLIGWVLCRAQGRGQGRRQGEA